MILSIVCIILAEVLKHFEYGAQKTDKNRKTETWRNIFLMLGQLSFLLTSGQGNNLSFIACEIFGALTHLLWLIFWSWTGKYQFTKLG